MYQRRAYFAAILILVLALGIAAPAFAVSSADVTAHANAAAAARRKAAEATALAAQLKAETDRLDDQVSALQAETDALDPQIAQASARTDRLKAELESLRAQIAVKTANIEEATAQYELEQQLLSDRVNATYRQGEWFYFDVLLGSSDVGDLITRTELVSRVIRSNNDSAVQIASTKADLEHSKAELDRTMQNVNLKKQEAAAAEGDLKGIQNRRQSKVDAQQSLLNQKSALMSASKKNASRLLAIAQAEEAESARIASMLSSHKGSGSYNGVMAWPVPGFYNVTSSFGYRIHPILKTRKLHAGIDIGKNGSSPINGQAIVAAGAGKVIWASSRSGYGNVVMIDHGNGVVSLYAHQQSGGIKVSNGQTVKKGQRVGTVGSTGYSTGPHLHFEVRLNGVPQNPARFLQASN
jgi:murein DD-endopeptidase MepM/ murein hydrolase activator NlpD